MSKNYVCNGCKFNKNGWCLVRKTNKGLKDLIECEYKKENKVDKLNEYLKQKKFELQIENNSFNRGFVKGLEIAIAILNREESYYESKT